jgi:hypothetical protein
MKLDHFYSFKRKIGQNSLKTLTNQININIAFIIPIIFDILFIYNENTKFF